MPPTEYDVLQQTVKEISTAVDRLCSRLDKLHNNDRSLFKSLDHIERRLAQTNQRIDPIDKLVFDHHAPLLAVHDIAIDALRKHVHTNFGNSAPNHPGPEPSSDLTWVAQVTATINKHSETLATHAKRLDDHNHTPPDGHTVLTTP